MSTSVHQCPICNSDMWDNSESKRNPKAPDHKCKDKSCDGAIWNDSKGTKKAAPAAAKAPPKGIDLGPYVPGLDEPEESIAQALGRVVSHPQPTQTRAVPKAITVAEEDRKLLADCLDRAIGAMIHMSVRLDEMIPKNDLVFTTDNICSMAATLFIETRKSGR